MKRAPVKNLRFVEDVMNTALDNDMLDEILWTRGDYVRGRIFKAAVLCSDIFYWGVADAEDLAERTLPLLRKAYDDCKAVKGPQLANGLFISNQYWGGTLYCARQRKKRPQGAYYTQLPEELWPLFNECGPERLIGAGNPYAPGEYDPDKMVQIGED